MSSRFSTISMHCFYFKKSVKFYISVQFLLCSALLDGCKLRWALNADLEYLRVDGDGTDTIATDWQNKTP